MNIKYSARLLEKIEGLCEYLINNSRLLPEEIEAYYEFCYDLLLERRKLDESSHRYLLNDALLEDDVSRLHLALHELIYDKN